MLPNLVSSISAFESTFELALILYHVTSSAPAIGYRGSLCPTFCSGIWKWLNRIVSGIAMFWCDLRVLQVRDQALAGLYGCLL